MHLMKDGSIIIFYEKRKSLSDSNKTSHVFWKRCGYYINPNVAFYVL